MGESQRLCGSHLQHISLWLCGYKIGKNLSSTTLLIPHFSDMEYPACNEQRVGSPVLSCCVWRPLLGLRAQLCGMAPSLPTMMVLWLSDCYPHRMGASVRACMRACVRACLTKLKVLQIPGKFSLLNYIPSSRSGLF